jgi:hypothetical protein
LTTSSILIPSLRRRGRVPGRFPICLHQGDEPRLGARRVQVFRKVLR